MTTPPPPMTTREYHRLLGLDPDVMALTTRVAELECRLEDLAALVAARRCTCQREEIR